VADLHGQRLPAGHFVRALRTPDARDKPWNPGSGNDPARFDAKSPAYQQAQALAKGVLNGTIQDQTQGATHFVSPGGQAALGRSMPSWAKGDPLASIGGHQFYAPNGSVSGDKIAGLGGSPATQGSTGPVPSYKLVAKNGSVWVYEETQKRIRKDSHVMRVPLPANWAPEAKPTDGAEAV
jgi:hypothetical protein